MKRISALLLAAVLLLACSVSAFAEDAAAPLTAEEIKTMIDDGTLDLNLIDLSDFYAKTTAVTIGDRAISPAMLNYSYVTQYYSFVRSYGSYAQYLGLDTSLGIQSLGAQNCAIADGGTWKDYFISAAVESLWSNIALSRYAEENGIALTQEEEETALSGMDTLEETAASNGFDSADAFLEATYGRGASVELLKEFSLEYALAAKAYQQISSGLTVTDDEVREQYPTIAVRHILVKAEADDEGKYTDEAKEAARARAEEILAEWQGGEATEESFAALAEQYSEDGGSNTNGGLYDSVSQGQMVKEFDEFCFDAGRAPGDTGIVYGESGSYAGYHVMYFVGEGSLEEGRNTILQAQMNTKLDELTAPYEVTYGPMISLAGVI